VSLLDKYIDYIRDIRRYSERTVQIYDAALYDYVSFAHDGMSEVSDDDIVSSMNVSEIRSYEVAMLDKGYSSKTVNLHISALSSFCRYLIKNQKLKSNPVRSVVKPKTEKRLPVFFRKESMDAYFEKTAELLTRKEIDFFISNHDSESGEGMYKAILARMIISLLYALGIRRSELISLRIGDVDFGRNVVKVTGKGDKKREIPFIASLCEELLLYLEAVETMCGGKRSLKEPLLITYKGKGLYPAYVDRVVKSELGDVKGITGRKSPHVLRHSLATELLNEGTDINSIKELLGHSSLAATQVYTHGSIARLKSIYEQAHPRAKNGGKHGD